MNEAAQEVHSTQLSIVDLWPTQVTVGLREVDVRRMRWQEKNLDHRAQYLSTHRVPVVIGPGNRYYMIDRHHLTMALDEEGIAEVPVSIIENFAELDFQAFWTALEQRSWTHPFDDEGRRCAFENMPTSITQLTDDPFRSLAGALKRMGGYAKNKAPFSEFRWADFLRNRVDRRLVERNFGRALAIAMNLAQSNEAAGLPGWQSHPEH